MARLPLMDIRQLRYFLAVAEELSFTRAAHRVGIAQPPLSKQIMNLEQELGTELFVRDRRRVQLTSAGETLVAHARQVIGAASNAIDAIRLNRGGARPRIRIGAVDSSFRRLLPDILRRLQANEPRIEIHLQEMPVSQQIAALTRASIDVGLARGLVLHKEIETRTLFQEALVIAAPAGRFAGEVSLDVVQLATEPMIAIAGRLSRSYRDQLFDIFSQHCLQPQIAHEVSDSQAALCLVAAGLGVAIVPASERDARSGVTFHSFSGDPPRVDIVITRQKDDRSHFTQKFIAAAQMCCNDYR